MVMSKKVRGVNGIEGVLRFAVRGDVGSGSPEFVQVLFFNLLWCGIAMVSYFHYQNCEEGKNPQECPAALLVVDVVIDAHFSTNDVDQH